MPLATLYVNVSDWPRIGRTFSLATVMFSMFLVVLLRQTDWLLLGCISFYVQNVKIL